MDRYVAAWETNDPDDIAALFTDEATYRTAPYRQPWRGREAIVRGWIDRRDDPGTWIFRSDVLAVGDGVGFVEGVTTYPGPPRRTYRNLWVIHMEGDRCRDFTEWWMEQNKDESGVSTVHLGQFSRELANEIAGELEVAGIVWWYKAPGVFSQIWEHGVRLFVDRKRLDEARAIVQRLAAKREG